MPAEEEMNVRASMQDLDWISRLALPDEQWFSLYGGDSCADAEQLAEFEALVTPLERRVGRPLSGPGRTRCLRAFLDNRRGFEWLAGEAARRGRLNPVGLLVRMVEAGEHKLIELAGQELVDTVEPATSSADDAHSLGAEDAA